MVVMVVKGSGDVWVETQNTLEGLNPTYLGRYQGPCGESQDMAEETDIRAPFLSLIKLLVEE